MTFAPPGMDQTAAVKPQLSVSTPAHTLGTLRPTGVPQLHHRVYYRIEPVSRSRILTNTWQKEGVITELWIGVIAGLAYLAASAGVFALGSSYYSLFRTNESWTFKGLLVAAFAPITWLTMSGSHNDGIGLLALAFLAAALANLLGTAAGTWLPRPLRLRNDSLKGIALLKALEAVVVVGTILVILLIARIPFRFVYLSLGKLSLGLAIGLGGFALFGVGALFQARSLRIERSILVGVLPWILLFVFANAFMEELWLRALFLKPLISLVGPIAAITLTAAVFALLHIGAAYMPKEDRIRFLIILFPLGLAWGACLFLTGSIIASALFHAGADLIVVNGFIANLHGQPKERVTA
ncbi:lysostaphin resistance A-like protein [Candidatus Bipolaricaulota bacterium]